MLNHQLANSPTSRFPNFEVLVYIVYFYPLDYGFHDLDSVRNCKNLDSVYHYCAIFYILYFVRGKRVARVSLYFIAVSSEYKSGFLDGFPSYDLFMPSPCEKREGRR